MFDLSIIIPHFNDWDNLGVLLDSIFSQPPSRFEVIVIDDASDSRCPLITDKALGRDNISLLRNERNLGPAYSRNRGLAKSRGAICMFMDSDDKVPPGYLDRLLRLFAEDRSLSVVFSTLRPETVTRLMFDFGLANYIFTSGTAIRSSVADRFDTNFFLCEDLQLWLRLKNKYKVKFLRYEGFESIRREAGLSISRAKDMRRADLLIRRQQFAANKNLVNLVAVLVSFIKNCTR